MGAVECGFAVPSQLGGALDDVDFAEAQIAEKLADDGWRAFVLVFGDIAADEVAARFFGFGKAPSLFISDGSLPCEPGQPMLIALLRVAAAIDHCYVERGGLFIGEAG